ncbi:MAG: hypothetical protein Q9164_006464 [Protoblastenia rupestris]
MNSQIAIHSIVLDAGPLLKNDPAVATLIAKSENLFTIPSVMSEIKDQHARSRIETILKPFLTIRIPRAQSLQFVIGFSKKSGDFSVLSRTDLEILALTYELECERNRGDWRIRRVPGQKTQNGAQPPKPSVIINEQSGDIDQLKCSVPDDTLNFCSTDTSTQAADSTPEGDQGTGVLEEAFEAGVASTRMKDLKIEDEKPHADITETIEAEQQEIAPHQSQANSIQAIEQQSFEKTIANQAAEFDADSSDSDGWITPSNLKKHQAKDLSASTTPASEDSTIQVACITTDFAMQNVLLQIGLNLLSPSLQRIRKIKIYILRCHACFQQVKDTSKQFCPRCGKPTLTRVSCSTNQKGEFRIHLKQKMQWNHRGDRYSIPKPVPGSANGKVGQGKGGGKGGWGRELILAEDQKEYQRAVNGGNGLKAKDLMDEDYLPSILTGDRGRAGGRPKIGAGRNVNAKKRFQ